jgi:hypothetical protein
MEAFTGLIDGRIAVHGRAPNSVGRSGSQDRTAIAHNTAGKSSNQVMKRQPSRCTVSIIAF